MKIKFTNFGYHHLIEKRDIPLDRHIRKPKVLSVIEVINFFVSIVLGVVCYVNFYKGFYWYSGFMGLVSLFYFLAAFLLATESKLFYLFSLLASLLLLVVCIYSLLKVSGAIAYVIGFLSLLPAVSVSIMVLNGRVRAYRSWVADHE